MVDKPFFQVFVYGWYLFKGQICFINMAVQNRYGDNVS